MKKTLVYITFFLLSACAIGQRTFKDRTYLFDPFTINPAVAGMGYFTTFKTGLSSEYLGRDNAAGNLYLSAHTCLTQPFHYLEHRKHHWNAIGAIVRNETNGAINSKEANISYAYNLHLDKTRLAFGAMLGIQYLSSKYFIHEKTLPTEAIGVKVYNEEFTLDLAFSNPFTPRIDLTKQDSVLFGSFRHSEATDYALRNGFHLICAYNFPINEDFSFQPVVYLRMDGYTSFVDFTAKLKHKTLGWIGFTMGDNWNFSLTAQATIAQYLDISYGYHSLSTSSNYYSEVHQFTLGYKLPKKIILSSPARFW